MMKSWSTSEAREHLSDIVNEVAFGKTRQVVSRHGKALVAIIPIEELQLLNELEKQMDLKEALDRLKEKSPIKQWKTLKKELNL